jgi:anaerobic ribonucleoside-triphosphate reductase activating protein
MNVRLHAIEPASRANGPGRRAVLWLQGCSLGCPGCFNPATHSFGDGFEADVATVADDILSAHAAGRIEGVSFSGGEPFQQPAALLDLAARLDHANLSQLAFSGFTRAEIERLPLGAEILLRLDVLIAGRFVERQRVGKGLLGSANQQIHLLTSRHTLAEFRDTPGREVILHGDGSITLSGIAPWQVRGA